MKKCPNCGTQLNDDVLFCTECGSQISQSNVCPHCGASVNKGDAFCQNCGKKVDEVPSSTPAESTQKKCSHCGASVNDGDTFCENCGKKLIEEGIDFTSNNNQKQLHATIEEPSNKMKMIIPIVISVVAIALGGGWWYWKSTQSSKEKNSIATIDTVNVEAIDSVKDNNTYSAEFVKQYLEGFLPTVAQMDINDTTLENHFSEDFIRLFKKVEKYDRDYIEDGNIGFWDFDFWTQRQDGELSDVKVIKVEKQSDNKATAIVQFIITNGEYNESKMSTSFDMIFEDGWRIDDFNNYKWRFNHYLKQPKEESADIIPAMDSADISTSY